MLEDHYYWVELFLEKCNIRLSKYEGNRNFLDKAILERHLDDLICIVDKSKDIPALQTLVVLILQVGARLPNNLKRRVLKSLNWFNDYNIYRWSPHVTNIRKIYLEDFKNKILNHKSGLNTFLLDLKIFYDKDLKYSIIGIEQLNSLIKEEECAHINYINLDTCGLMSIPKIITNFPNLTSLSLDNNYITSLPDSIENLRKLRKLYLIYNRIEYVSPNIGCLSNLERIYLSYNQIKTLPLSLRYLRNLRQLYLDNNNLKVLPDIFNNLKLSYFNLRNNPIMNISSSLKEFPNLKGIYSNFN